MDPIDDEDEQQKSVATMPLAPTQPQQAAVAAPPMAQKQAPLPGMPPSVDQNELGQYLAGQKQAIDKYGPEKQLDTTQSLIKARTSPGMSLASGGAGLADAIMQGVAGAGNPGFQKNLQEQGNQLAGEAGGAMKSAHEQQMQEINAKMGVDEKDPNSQLSKSAQAASMPVLLAAGIPKADIPFISADLADRITSHAVDLKKAEGEIALQKAQLAATTGLRQDALHQEAKHQTVTEQQEAAKKLADRGVIKSAVESVPFLRSDATKKLRQEAGIDAPETSSVGPLGAETVKDGKTYVWSPTTGKYHPK